MTDFSIKAIGCDGKVAFDSYDLANMAAQRKHGKADIGRQAYKCEFCKKFHVGNPHKRIDNKRRRKFVVGIRK